MGYIANSLLQNGLKKPVFDENVKKLTISVTGLAWIVFLEYVVKICWHPKNNNDNLCPL